MKPEYKGLAPKDRVIKAGVALLRSGSRPTIDAIVEEIGGSSKSTVNDYLPDLWRHIAETIDVSEALVAKLPHAVQQDFNDALTVLALEMKKAASTEFNAERQALEQQLADADQESRTHQAEVEESKRSIREVEQLCRSLEQRLHGLQSDLDMANAKYQDLSEHYDDAKTRIHDGERENIRLQSANERLMSETHRLSDTIAQLERSLERERQLVADMTAEVAAQSDMRASETERLRLQIEALQQQAVEANRALEASRISEAKYSHRVDSLEQSLDAAQQRVASLESDAKRLMERNTRLERENAAAQAILTEHSSRLETPADKKTSRKKK